MFKLEFYDERFRQSFDSDIELEDVAGGFRFLEGPAWHPKTKTLYFSDIMGNGIYKFKDGKISLFRGNSYLANGNTFNRLGELITCEHGTSRVSLTSENGDYHVLASKFQGKALNSPNDVICDGEGNIYFTDPNPGRKNRVGIPREQELPYQGVYLLESKSGELKLLDDQLVLPNGLCLNQDGKLLYVNDSHRQAIYVYDVCDDKSVKNKRLFAELIVDKPGCADGMKIGGDEFLYCSAPGGIQVFDNLGKMVGRIFTPEVAANFTWGGNDMKDLYLTATSRLYRLRTKVAGVKTF